MRLNARTDRGCMAMFLADFYKLGHIDQYSPGITHIWVNWTPRASRYPEIKDVIHFGLNRFIKKYLIDYWNDHFFNVSIESILADYRELVAHSLFDPNPRTDHIVDLHRLGYLPLKIYSLPEGNAVNIGVPMFVMVNTDERFFWLPNFLETLDSCELWKPATSATIAREYRRIGERWAKQAGETDLSFIDWQFHDFSMRGMGGIEDAILSGMGHLTMFTGTDTIPAIIELRDFYGASLKPGAPVVGGSVNATEHSVMSAGSAITAEGEYGTYRRLLTEVYPKGILSIVSDTYDLWAVLTDFIPRLKDVLDNRDGKLVIRPDSGDPVEIICGEFASADPRIKAGVLRLLAQAMGTFERPGKLPLIGKPHALYGSTGGAIYGDSITPDRTNRMLGRIVQELRLSSFNMVLGVGSYTYVYQTRDTFGNAMKATAVRRDGKIVPIFKKPVTDSGTKISAKGITAVFDTTTKLGDVINYKLTQNAEEWMLDNCAFEVTLNNGDLLIDPSLETIRKRARSTV